MKWKKQLEGMQAYKPGRSAADVKAMYGLEEIVKLASNENPFGCSPSVREFLANYEENHAIYPDGYATELRKAVAEANGIGENQLLFGDGSDEIIVIISRALLGPGVNTVMATPSFSQYKHNAVLEGAEIREVPLTDGKHDIPRMIDAADDQTAVVWICSPNNPTGVLTPTDEIIQLLEAVSEDVLVVLDEAYFEYVTDERYTNAVSLLERYPNLLIMRTFSKAYGLAAFRVGYAMANAAVISALDPVRPPFNVTSPSQGAALAAIRDQQYILDCRERNARGMAQYEAFAAEQNLHIYPSSGNFVLLEVKRDSDEVFEELMKEGFIVRSGNALGTPGYIRITIGTEEQNSRLLKVLGDVLA